MNGGRCAGCSEPARRGCHCGRVPTNLAFVQGVLNVPNTRPRRKCARNCTSCVVVAVGGDSVDCLCNLDHTLHAKSDHRLQCWERELQLRNSLAERLMQRTGKSCCELLFNRPGTVDVRDKLMMQRLLAHAESRNPRARHKKAVIRDKFPGCCCTKEISSAKPATKKYFEISGLPAGVKCELIGENCCDRRSGWITSRTVQALIAAKGSDIKRVLPFFPDIEHLQVIGKKMAIYNGCDDEETEDTECPCCSSGSVSLESCGEVNGDTCDSDCGSYSSDEIDEDHLVPKTVGSTIPERPGFISGQGLSLPQHSPKCLGNFMRLQQQQQHEDPLVTPLGCSDNDFDYYSELICNRARCHELFYKL